MKNPMEDQVTDQAGNERPGEDESRQPLGRQFPFRQIVGHTCFQAKTTRECGDGKIVQQVKKPSAFRCSE